MDKNGIINFLTSYKHKDNEVISYINLNNKADGKTVTDTKNIIATAVKQKDTAFITDMIKAIYNVKGDVLFDTKTQKFVLIEKQNASNIKTSTVTMNIDDNTVSFILDGNKRKITFELPSIIETDWKKVKQDIANELSKSSIKSKDDFKKFTDNILKTLK